MVAKAKTKTETQAPETIVSIKGFDADMKCRGFQFEVGKTYTAEGKVVACQNGFHAVDAANPFHVWDFYPIISDDGKLTRYAEAVQSGAMDRQEDDNKRGTKIASATITITAELSLPDFIKRAVNAIFDATKGKGDNPSGYSARIGSSGNSAQIGSSGDYAQIGSSGNSARIGSSGNSAQIDASGKDAVVASAGPGTRVKGSRGTWISVAEFNDDGKCIGFATGCIGHDGLTPDTFYVAKGGKLVAA